MKVDWIRVTAVVLLVIAIAALVSMLWHSGQ